MRLTICLNSAVALGLILLAGCDRAKPTSQPQSQQHIVPVQPVVQEPLQATADLPAELTPYEAVAIYPKVSAFLEWIGVDRGSHVKKGDLLIRLTAPELDAQRAQAESHLQSAQAALLAAKAKLESDQGTNAHLRAAAETPGVVAGNDLLVSDQTVKADQANVSAAERNVQAAQDTLKSYTQIAQYLEVRAPFNSIVTERNVHPGALVGPSVDSAQAVPMLRIQMLDHLRLVIPVPQADVSDVTNHATVTFTVPAYPSQTFSGVVARNSHAIDQATRTMPVELDVKNTDGKLTPGTYAQVHWPIHRSQPSLFVPRTAIATNQEQTFVIRIANGKAQWVDVKTGVYQGDQAEVFGDLHPGDLIAVRGTDEIQAGASVKAQPASAQH
jgi:membrane fusion protein, multidrug efflux system